MPSKCALTLIVSHMLRWSCTLGMYPHFEAAPQSLGVACRRNAPALCGPPACFGGCVFSERTSGLRLPRALRGLRALGLHVRFKAIPRAPSVVYPQSEPALRCYPACSVCRVPSQCTLTLMLPHMLGGSRTLGMCPHFEAFPHASRVASRRTACSARSPPTSADGCVPSERTLTLLHSRNARPD